MSKTKLEFKDITNNTYRRYTFPGGDTVCIMHPVSLNVSPSGGHRICDKAGKSHYIPPKWIHLVWEQKEGCEPFAF